MTHDLLAYLIRGAGAASVALALVLALRVSARRRFGASFAYRLWLLVPIAVLTTFLPAPVRPLLPVLQVAPSALAASAPIELRAAVDGVAPIDWRPWLLALWAIGATALVAIFVRQQQRYLKNLGRLEAAANGALRAEATTGCPALIGALRPRIVVPSDFESRYTPRERELVLAHEHVHLARGDAQINALAALLRCLNWFNPLFHFAASRFRFDQEIACDAAVMSRFPEARRSYADAMLKAQLVGESQQELRLPAGCHWPSSHPLKERIAMLKFPKLRGPRRGLANAVLVALTLSAGLASWAAQPGKIETSADTGSQTTVPTEIQGYRRMFPPKYPAEALRSQVSGMVMLKVAVDEYGVPTSAEVESVKPEQSTRVLADAAIAAAMQWRFKPGTEDGKPVPGFVNVPVDFRLTDGVDDKPLPPVEPTTKDVNVSYRKMRPPVYPKDAIAARIGGTLYVRAHVDAEGNVGDTFVDQAVPLAALALKDSALATIKAWQFNPPIRGGKTVESDVLVPMQFRIEGAAAAAADVPVPTYPDSVRKLETIIVTGAAS